MIVRSAPVRAGTTAPQPEGTWAIAAMSLLETSGATASVLSPTIIASPAKQHGLSPAIASAMSMAELIGTTLALLVSPFVVDRFDRRKAALIAVVAAIAAQLLSLVAGDPMSLSPLRALAGTGTGTAFAVALASLAGTPRPSRLVGVSATVNQVAGASILALTAAFSDMVAGGTILVLVSVIAAAGLLTRFLPPESTAHAADRNSDDAPWPSITVAIDCSAAMFLLVAGFGTTWPLIEQVGAARGTGTAEVKAALGVAGGSGIVAGLAAAWLGDRLGNLWPLPSAGLGLDAAMPLTLMPDLPLPAVMVGFMFCWVFVMPHYFGAVAGLDRTGRLASFASAMRPLGVAVGKAERSLVAQSFGFRASAWVGSAGVITSTLVLASIFAKGGGRQARVRAVSACSA